MLQIVNDPRTPPDEWDRTAPVIPENVSFGVSVRAPGAYNPSPESPKMSLAAGTRLGPYQVLSLIGTGGMGEVYKAKDTRLDRTVAIKVLPDEISGDPARRARFEREAKTIASLSHAHICNLYDVGEHAGCLFLVLEHLDGQTLADRIRKGPLPVEEALEYGAQIAQALSAAHRAGIIHRDLKPGNVMLTDSGAKLLDFGLAKLKAPSGEALTPLSRMTTGETATVPGQILGTLPYMAPEQLEGMEADARSDIWALGCVLYEALSGRRAFQGESPISTVTAVIHDEPRPVREHVKGVPAEAENVVLRCLRKAREKRYATASEVEHELQNCRALVSRAAMRIDGVELLRRARRPVVAIPALVVLLALGGLSAWWLRSTANIRWARTQALPRIEQLIEQEKRGDAFALAIRAAEYIPDDPVLAKLWPQISWTPSIRTTPPGATIFRRNYGPGDDAWELVGLSPIENRRFPLVDSQWKVEMKGAAAVERSTLVLWGTVVPSGPISVVFSPETPPGMVHQDIGRLRLAPLETTPVALFGLAGFEDAPAVRLKDYWIDRFEVTNKQFKAFLDHGGYEKQEYWKQVFVKDGRTLSWAEAMSLFRDSTGRPGPSTWVQGDFPRGREDFPVMGVSWYEAEAYAEFVGKKLPTIYHWVVAASPWAAASILPASNFGREGPAAVGSFRGMSWTGAYDMAGNAKEWCWNAAGAGTRYTMGGAWDEPDYMFNNGDARSPFDRSANLGFRCAKYGSDEAAGRAGAPIVPAARDFDREHPVPEAVFNVYKSFYSYDKTPLRASVESVEETGEWRREKVTFAAAYGNERVIAYLFLPKKSRPPFHAIVRFPGSETIDIRSSATLPAFEMQIIDFEVKSGRAVMLPVYKGTFERGDDLRSDIPNMTSSWRDHVIAWSKDLGRSIDYLETRPDIDSNKIAYEGTSWGAAMGSLLPAVEDRIKACVLIVGGFNFQRSLPEVDELNFAPRVKVPVLMLNGTIDFFYPATTSQEPMFRLLGTPMEHKRRVVYATGHNVPRNELIKEMLEWLDRYLGPVR